jgi:transcriptional regulator with XRE-family HTH domain
LSAQFNMSRLVRELRDLTGLTQEKFAAKLGVTFPTINRWENDRAKPSPLALEKIESLLRSLGDKGKVLHKAYFGKGA